MIFKANYEATEAKPNLSSGIESCNAGYTIAWELKGCIKFHEMLVDITVSCRILRALATAGRFNVSSRLVQSRTCTYHKKEKKSI